MFCGTEMVELLCDWGVAHVYGLESGDGESVLMGLMCCLLCLYLWPWPSMLYDLGVLVCPNLFYVDRGWELSRSVVCAVEVKEGWVPWVESGVHVGGDLVMYEDVWWLGNCQGGLSNFNLSLNETIWPVVKGWGCNVVNGMWW